MATAETAKEVPPAMRIKEAVAYVGLSVMTLRRVADGTLHPRLMAKTLVFMRDDLDAFEATREQGAGQN